MSLKQKYTWNAFKKEMGEKAKDLKRTSAEGKKAFEAAFKAKTKKMVEERIARYKKQSAAAEKALVDLKGKLKGLTAESRKKAILKRISGTQHALRDFTEAIKNDQARSL